MFFVCFIKNLTIKKTGFKQLLENKLNQQDWEIEFVGSDEHWKVQHLHIIGLSFYLCYIVDPQFKGDRKKGQGVYQILATTTFPENWNDYQSRITSIELTKRKFNIKLELFFTALDKFKRKGGI